MKDKIGLALSGGAVYGAAHVGVLRALEEKDIQINAVSGTSIGAFVGAFVAFGLKWRDIQKIVLDINWLDISNLAISRYGFLSNADFGNVIRKHLGDVNFEDAEIPFYAMATDISNGNAVVLSEGKVADAVTASTCIPGIFKPVSLNGRMLVDGGVVENVPISPLKGIDLDRIIAVDLNTNRSERQPSNILEVLLNSFHFLMRAASESYMSGVDILIKPNLSEFNYVDTKQAPELLQRGYAEASFELKQLLAS